MLIFLDIVNRAVTHTLIHLRYGCLIHSAPRIFYLNIQKRIFQIYPHVYPAGRSLFFHAVNTGIFHKRCKCQLRHIIIRAYLRQVHLISQPISETVLLQFQICFHETHFLLQLYMIGCPVDILPFQNRQLFYHTCRHLLSLNQRPHPDAFQHVKEKMGIDLAV